MSTELVPYADDFAAVFSASVRQTLRTALGRNCQIASGERLAETPAPTDVAMVLELAEGGAGSVSICMAFAEGALLADLMMMGDGSAEWSDDHIDALRELGSQVAGGMTTGQSERWNRRIVFRASVGEGIAPEGSACYPLSLEIQGVEARQAFLVLDPSLQQTLRDFDEERQQESDFPRGDDFHEGVREDGTSEAPAPAAAASSPGAAPGAVPATVWIESNDPSVQRLLDVPIEVTIELGQTELSIRRILEIGPGSIIELDRMAGEPVDLVVNDKVIAHGEVVVIEENFGIRITQLVTPDQRKNAPR